jgi:hypothetical protein
VIPDDLTSEAQAERDAALARVEDAADPEWLLEARRAIFATACACPTFISDDVWTVGGLVSTREDRALGPVFLAMSREGLIEKTGEQRPSVRSHLSGKPVWRSNVYGVVPVV